MFRRRAETGERLLEVVERFRQKGAVSPDKALTVEELGLPELRGLMERRLGQLGIFVEVNGKYYLSEARLKEIGERPGFTLGARSLPPNVGEVRDVVFGTGGGRPLRLNIARPRPSPGEPMPVIVFIHGGAWAFGDYKGPQNYPFAAEGYFTANIEYRLSSEATFPAQIEDCKAAVRWLRANAEKYNVDPDRVGVWGTSAGGHLVALLGTSGDIPELEGEGGSEGFSSRVQAVVDFFGPTDLTKMGGRDNPDSPVRRLVGGPLHERADLVRMANPITYVTPDDPSFLLVHGEKDRLVPFDQSELLYNALKEAGVEATLVKVENAGHGFRPDPPGATVKPSRQEILQMMMDFFDKHLKK